MDPALPQGCHLGAASLQPLFPVTLAQGPDVLGPRAGKPGDFSTGPVNSVTGRVMASSVTTCHLSTGNTTFMPLVPASTDCLYTTCLSTLTLTLQPCSYLWPLPRASSQSPTSPGSALLPPGSRPQLLPSAGHTAPWGPIPSMQNQGCYHPTGLISCHPPPTDSPPVIGPKTFAHAVLSARMVFLSPCLQQLAHTSALREPSLLSLEMYTPFPQTLLCDTWDYPALTEDFAWGLSALSG